jgi:hypothetical protein
MGAHRKAAPRSASARIRWRFGAFGVFLLMGLELITTTGNAVAAVPGWRVTPIRDAASDADLWCKPTKYLSGQLLCLINARGQRIFPDTVEYIFKRHLKMGAQKGISGWYSDNDAAYGYGIAVTQNICGLYSVWISSIQSGGSRDMCLREEEVVKEIDRSGWKYEGNVGRLSAPVAKYYLNYDQSLAVGFDNSGCLVELVNATFLPIP